MRKPATSPDWINSSIQARVERVLKHSQELPLKSGDLITFEESGGIATLNGVTVEAVVPWLRPMAAGTRYLVFASVLDGKPLKNDAYEERKAGRLSLDARRGLASSRECTS